jgi:hypothetical protein
MDRLPADVGLRLFIDRWILQLYDRLCTDNQELRWLKVDLL